MLATSATPTVAAKAYSAEKLIILEYIVKEFDSDIVYR